MKKLYELTPPGTDTKKEMEAAAWVAFVTIFLWSLIFVLRYFAERQNLYEVVNRVRYLRKGAVMKPIGQLMNHVFTGFWIYAIFHFASAAGYYRSFYTESRSIYVMKRLKDKWELHRRCLTLPFFRLCFGGMLVLVLMLVYFLLYRFATPEECLPYHIGFDFWGSLL